jgi:ABC-2 type transport system ATP-binding protein
MSFPIVKVQNLTKRIKNKEIVKNISFDINKGEIVGFLGPNGSGKTTTMKMMLGLTSITEGDILINGNSIRENKEKALKYVGGIIEYPEMYKFLSGYDNLIYFQRITGDINKQRINNLVSLVGLSDVINKKVKTYSLGMKQRLGIAQALLSSPNLLILDEPMNGLDPKGIYEMRDFLRRLAKEENIAIFISSHLLSEIELLCDRLIIIQNGTITDIDYVKNWRKNSELITISINADPKDQALDVLKRKMFDVKEKDRYLSIYLPYNQIPIIINELVSYNIKIYSVIPKVESLEERYLVKTSGGY